MTYYSKPSNDSVIVVKRKGTLSDPFRVRHRQFQILNKRGILLEIPDEYSGVSIAGYSEASGETISPNRFKVDYKTGILSFNVINEGQTVDVDYMGTGYILYPSSRIYVHRAGVPDVVTTLQDIITDGESALISLDQLNDKISETNTAISNANAATTSANSATVSTNIAITNANVATTNATTATANANTAKDMAITATNSANTATANANVATTNANNATTNANSAATNANSAVSNLSHVGTYSASTTYNNRNVVSYNGSSYMCIADGTINIVPTDTLKWKLVSIRGDIGPRGIQGIVGPRGIIWTGAFDISHTYNLYDSVSYTGRSYILKVSAPAGTLPTDSTKWDLLSDKGLDGAGAVNSVNGFVGDVSLTAVEIGAISNITTSGTGLNASISPLKVATLSLGFDPNNFAVLNASNTFTANQIINARLILHATPSVSTPLKLDNNGQSNVSATMYLDNVLAASIGFTSGDKKTFLLENLKNGGLTIRTGGGGSTLALINSNGEIVLNASNFVMIKGVRFWGTLGSAPTSPPPDFGDRYFDMTLFKDRVYDGTIWNNLW